MANILVSGVRMDMGGTEIAQIAFMNKLLSEGHKVTLLLSQKRGPLIDKVPDGVRILTIPMKKSIFLDRMMERVIDGRPFAFPVKCICKIIKICIGKKDSRPFSSRRPGYCRKIMTWLWNFTVTVNFRQLTPQSV